MTDVSPVLDLPASVGSPHHAENEMWDSWAPAAVVNAVCNAAIVKYLSKIFNLWSAFQKKQKKTDWDDQPDCFLHDEWCLTAAIRLHRPSGLAAPSNLEEPLTRLAPRSTTGSPRCSDTSMFTSHPPRSGRLCLVYVRWLWNVLDCVRGPVQRCTQLSVWLCFGHRL